MTTDELIKIALAAKEFMREHLSCNSAMLPLTQKLIRYGFFFFSFLFSNRLSFSDPPTHHRIK